jgi:hypothetical protein
MRLRERLNRLERRAEKILLPTRCPACQDRVSEHMIMTSRARADDTLVFDGVEPKRAPCPRCGRAPEPVLKVIEVVVTTREEARKVLEQCAIRNRVA